MEGQRLGVIHVKTVGADPGTVQPLSLSTETFPLGSPTTSDVRKKSYSSQVQRIGTKYSTNSHPSSQSGRR